MSSPFLSVGHSGGVSLKLFRFLKLTAFFFRAAAPSDAAEGLLAGSSDGGAPLNRCSAKAGAIGATVEEPQPMLLVQIAS